MWGAVNFDSGCTLCTPRTKIAGDVEMLLLWVVTATRTWPAGRILRELLARRRHRARVYVVNFVVVSGWSATQTLPMKTSTFVEI